MFKDHCFTWMGLKGAQGSYLLLNWIKIVLYLSEKKYWVDNWTKKDVSFFEDESFLD